MVQRPTAYWRGFQSPVRQWFFSQNQFSLQTLLRCPYSTAPCAIACTSISVRTLKLPNTGSHIIVWPHENTTHTDKNGQRCSCGCCAFQGNPIFPQGTKKCIIIVLRCAAPQTLQKQTQCYCRHVLIASSNQCATDFQQHSQQISSTVGTSPSMVRRVDAKGLNQQQTLGRDFVHRVHSLCRSRTNLCRNKSCMDINPVQTSVTPAACEALHSPRCPGIPLSGRYRHTCNTIASTGAVS